MSISVLFPRLKVLGLELLGTITAATGAITAQQQQFEWWLRQAGAIVAILSGMAVIYRVFRPRKGEQQG